MRAAAEIDELRAQRIFGKYVVGLLFDELALHFFAQSGVLLESFGFGSHHSIEGQIFGLELPHLGLDFFQIFRSEGGRTLEIVIEPVLDGRTNAQLGFREQLEHGGCQQVRGRVPVDFQGGRIFGGQNLHAGVLFNRALEIIKLAVDLGHDGCVGQARADRARNIGGPCPGFDRPAAAVGQSNGNAAHRGNFQRITRFPANASGPETSRDMMKGPETPIMSVSGSSASIDDEAALVAQARTGNAAAFSSLVERYEGKIFRLAQHITQNREDAEDVLQETFLKAYEHLDQFQGAARFYTWIVRIAVNQALMKLRKRKSDRTVSMDEEIDTGEDTVVREIAGWDENPEQQFSREEMTSILNTAVDGLPPIYRAVFVLRDVDELSTEETAEALNLSIPAVKSRLLRARLQLRDKLTRYFKRKGDDAFAYL